MSSPTVALENITKRHAAAVGVLFFVNGCVFSNWLPRVPEVRDRLGISNAGLGAALIGGGLGGLIGSFFVARLLTRFGSRRLVLLAAPALALLLPLIAVVPSALALAAVLTSLGFLDVQNDMAMNAQGVIVQEALSRSIMQRLHAAWSMGFVVGAGIGSIAAAAEISIGVHLTTVSALLLITLFVVRHRLVKVDPPAPERVPGARRGVSAVMVAMSVMAVAIAWIEVTPNEWGAVILSDVHHTTRAAGVATVVFAAAMLSGRLVGDHVVDRFGSRRVFDGALLVAFSGAGVLIVAPGLWLALVGFAIWGLGVSVLFPQLYGMAATLPGTSTGAGLGAMAMGQRLGGLISPLIVGAIAEAHNLRWSLAIIVSTAMLLVLVTRRSVSAGVGSAAG
jgi:MFS family permease